MYRQLFRIGALLVGSAFLLFAGGLHGLLLPLRGNEEGFSAFALGLLGTGWAVGYISGCLMVPRMVARVGHIRAFSTMAGLAAISILASLLLIHAGAWIALRIMAGFCFAGAAMIVESWLNERTDERYRGRVFGIYTMVNLGASTAGQMSLTVGDTTGYALFVVGGIFYALAIFPTALTGAMAPKPMVAARLDLRTLWRNSPLAVAGVLLVGVSNSAFGALGPVFGERIGLGVTTIALFMSAALVAGAFLQIPVGILSDRMDRRYVLLGLAGVAATVDLVFIFLAPTDPLLVLVLASAFGSAVFAMYPVIVAHANDHAPPDYFILTSGGLLLLFGVGSMVGPLTAGAIMGSIGPRGLFITSAMAHVALILYGVWRIGRRAAPAPQDKSDFHVAPLAPSSTPQTIVLNPGADEEIAHEAAAEAASDEAPPGPGPEG